MIQLSGLTKGFGDRVLLDSVTWQINDGERVGLCGANGSGKTTLLRMLAGLEEIDAGTVVRPNGLRVGYLPQDGLVHSGRTVHEEAGLAFGWLLDIKAEMHELESRLGDQSIPEAEHDGMLARYSDLQDRFRVNDGYQLDLKIATVLHGLGFSDEDFGRPTETFSGGWQMRLALAKLLLARPDLLLLDEPTNHLDLEARNWLEEYLLGYPHAVILVSHDRFFLDAVVHRIADLSLRALTDYPGSYTHYLEESQARLDRLRKARREQDEGVARMKMFVDRFRYQATKAAQVQSRVKMLEKVVPIEVPPERKKVHFTFPTAQKSGRMVFELADARKAYGDILVFRRITLHVERGDRIALVGPNGTGKSTLMRLLAGAEPPDRGTRREGHQVVAQYFRQDEAARLDPSLTVHETLASGSPVHMVPMIRDILGGFLFSGDDIYKKAGMLSGGERTRLAVARMLLRPSNTLLLDEPTNHLDLDSKDVLLEALDHYGGTLVFVSHDRYFVEKLATRIVEVGHGEATLYPGTYSEFLWRREHPELARTGRRPGVPDDPGRPAPSRSPRPAARPSRDERVPQGASQPAAPVQPAPRIDPAADREARKRASAELRRQEKAFLAVLARIAALEARIAEREAAVKTLEETMSDPTFYRDRETSQPVLDRHQALMWEVGDLMGQWEDLQAEADRLRPVSRSGAQS